MFIRVHLMWKFIVLFVCSSSEQDRDEWIKVLEYFHVVFGD